MRFKVDENLPIDVRLESGFRPPAEPPSYYSPTRLQSDAQESWVVPEKVWLAQHLKSPCQIERLDSPSPSVFDG